MDIMENIKCDGICKHFVALFKEGRGVTASEFHRKVMHATFS